MEKYDWQVVPIPPDPDIPDPDFEEVDFPFAFDDDVADEASSGDPDE